MSSKVRSSSNELKASEKDEDEWLKQLNERCARAMIRWFTESQFNTQRSINSLTLEEFNALAEACTSEWIVIVSQRERKDLPAVYESLLFG